MMTFLFQLYLIFDRPSNVKFQTQIFSILVHHFKARLTLSSLHYTPLPPSRTYRIGRLKFTLWPRELYVQLLWGNYQTHIVSENDWQTLLDRIDKKLVTGKSNYLSKGSRLTLINSILTGLPLYFMSFVFILRWIINRMDQVCWSFFWKGCGFTSGAQCLVSWSVLCSPCGYKGMGIKNLWDFSIVLLAKW